MTDNDALVRERYLSDRFEWAAPGDQQEDAWLLRFCDNDVRDLIWTGEDAEQEAWAAWNLHAPGYNCYLFRLAALRSTPQAKPLDLPAQDEVDRKDVEGIRLHAGRIFARMKRTPHGSKRSLLTDQYIAKFDEAKFAEGWNAALDRHRAGDDALREENARLRGLVDEARVELRHAAVFVRSREKMHPIGVALYDELLAKLGAST